MANFSEKELSRACPICLFNIGQVLRTQHFTIPSGYNLDESYDIVCCKNCGFCYADVSSLQGDYDIFYAKYSKYSDEKISSGGNLAPWDKERFRETARDISGVMPNRVARILDIGCANAGLLAALKEIGYNNLVGIDPSHDCVVYTRKQGFEAYAGSIFSDTFLALSLKEEFDCIVLSHVLEHVCDLRLALSHISSKLKAGGILYVEVPDASRYADFYKVPYYYFDYEHINHFDERALENLLSGFSLKCLISSKKEIAASLRDLYPAFYAAYERRESQSSQKKIVFNSVVRDNIIKYIELSQQDCILNQLKELVESQENIVVWGAGSYTARLLSETVLDRCSIAYFVDSDPKKHGLVLNGLNVYSPEKLKNHSGPIVVSSALFSDDIVRNIMQMKLENRIIVLRK